MTHNGKIQHAAIGVGGSRGRYSQGGGIALHYQVDIRPGDLVVVDPRFSVAASKARHWLPIKPGTDLALLLAWMHVLVSEGLYDRDYVDAYALGFEQLKAHVQATSPEWAYPRTGIEPETIRATARLMAAARPATAPCARRRRPAPGSPRGPVRRSGAARRRSDNATSVSSPARTWTARSTGA